MSEELLQRLVGMVADLQTSQLRLLENQNSLREDVSQLQEDMTNLIKLTKLNRAELDRNNTIQLNLIERVKELEGEK